MDSGYKHSLAVHASLKHGSIVTLSQDVLRKLSSLLGVVSMVETVNQEVKYHGDGKNRR